MLDESILENLGEYRHRGHNKREYKICPFCGGGEHNDHWKFVVFIEEPFKNSYYKCVRGSCGVTGNIRSLVEHVTGDKPVIKYEKKEIVSKPKIKPKVVLDPLTEVQKKYLEKRGLRESTYEHFEIGNKNNLLAFPFYMNGELTFLKYRKAQSISKGEPKMSCEPDAQAILFNMKKTKDSLIVCEGEFDCMIVWQVAGEKYDVVSVPTGAQGFTWLGVPECHDFITSYNRVYLWGDADEAGKKFNEEMSKKIGKEFCYYIPHDGKWNDPNEIYYKMGSSAIMGCISNAVSAGEGRWINVSDIPYESLLNQDHLRSRFNVINQCFGGYVYGEWYLITGHKGHGKSSFTFGELLYLVSQGVKIAVFSGEQRRKQFKRWLVGMALGEKATIVYDSIRSKHIISATEDEIKMVDRYIDDKLFFYNVDEFEKDSNNILESMEYAYKRYDIKVFLIDNLMTVDFKSFQYKSEEAVQFLTGMKALVEKYSLINLVIAHPRKKVQDDNKDTFIPTIDSIKGLGEIGNYAQNVLVIHKLNDHLRSSFTKQLGNGITSRINSAKALVRTLKERETGAEGVDSFLGFNETSKRFYDVDSDGNEIKNLLNSYKFPWEEIEE